MVGVYLTGIGLIFNEAGIGQLSLCEGKKVLSEAEALQKARAMKSKELGLSLN